MVWRTPQQFERLVTSPLGTLAVVVVRRTGGE